MPSRREIARDWHVAKSWVDRCVTERGCPTSSLEEARKWREENSRRSVVTYQRSIVRQIEEEEDSNSPEARILIPLATAKDIAWRGYDAILDLVDRLPKNAAAQCNAGNPEIAFAVLEAECEYILCYAYEAYAAWSKVGPHLFSARNPG
jgi:hypothetical protein